MPKKLTKGQTEILQALCNMGGIATAREIAAKMKLKVIAVTSSLSVISKMPGIILYQESKLSGDSRWHLE